MRLVWAILGLFFIWVVGGGILRVMKNRNLKHNDNWKTPDEFYLQTRR